MEIRKINEKTSGQTGGLLGMYNVRESNGQALYAPPGDRAGKALPARRAGALATAPPRKKAKTALIQERLCFVHLYYTPDFPFVKHEFSLASYRRICYSKDKGKPETQPTLTTSYK